MLQCQLFGLHTVESEISLFYHTPVLFLLVNAKSLMSVRNPCLDLIWLVSPAALFNDTGTVALNAATDMACQ